MIEVDKLPSALRPFAAALELVPCRPHDGERWLAHGYPQAAAEPLRPGAPPYDGVYRGSWVSPGVCMRLDLEHSCVPNELRERLRASFPEKLGGDGALYQYGVDARSQRDNRAYAMEELGAMVARSTSPTHGSTRGSS